MRYLLPCECGQKIPVSAGQAGQAIACACQRSVSVPQLRELRQLPVATDSQTSNVAPTAAAERWNQLHTLWFISVIAMVVSLVVVGLMFVARERLSTWTAENQAEVDGAVIDSLGIDQVLGAWIEFSGRGLGEPAPQPYMYDKGDREFLSRWIRLLLVLVTLPATVLAGLLGRKLRLNPIGRKASGS
ncbi:MAG: hypothetical protein ACKPEY_04670 [Planctomycetota bacterium]